MAYDIVLDARIRRLTTLPTQETVFWDILTSELDINGRRLDYCQYNTRSRFWTSESPIWSYPAPLRGSCSNYGASKFPVRVDYVPLRRLDSIPRHLPRIRRIS